MVDEVLAKSFENVGEEYDRYRPGFPAEAADLLLPGEVGTALDLGAGTGKFTELLTARARRVIAVEPSEPMLDVLRAKLPDVESRRGTAERIPVGDGSIDAISVAQAFHWFDRVPACEEMRRVLVPGGVLGLVWNHSNPDCAWDTAAHRIAHPVVSEPDGATTSGVDELPGFRHVGYEQIRWSERIARSDYLGRWATVSTFLAADDDTRARMLSAIEAVLDTDPETRGRGEYDLPIITDVFLYRRM